MLPRMSDAELRRLYIDEQKGCPEIGKIADRDPKTIFAWLREAGIPTRPRGSYVAVHFKKGERSAFFGRSHSEESKLLIGAASKRQGRVPYLKNGKHHLVGAPPWMNPNWKGGVTPERQTFYRSSEWKSACVAVWQRADAKCERCGSDYRDADRDAERFHVHHIVSFACWQLRAVMSNLVLLCLDCHRFVHSKANVAREFLAEPPDWIPIELPDFLPVRPQPTLFDLLDEAAE